MTLTVMKFGGSSVADKDKIKNVSDIICSYRERGDSVIAVLSAQGDTTDELLKKAFEMSSSPDKRETDMLISAGEQMSIALCAIELKDRGIDAVSLTGAQAGIKTDDTYGDGNIILIHGDRIRRELEAGKVVVIAGFQGENSIGDIVTLGRGGSDTTAVAVCAMLGGDECILFKDVDGIYTSDPRQNSNAVLLDEISYDDMLALIEGGSKVLHKKCVEMAKEYGLAIKVKSSFKDVPGTVVK